MTPAHEVDVRKLPGDIKKGLSRKEKAETFRIGAAFLKDKRNGQIIKHDLPVDGFTLNQCEEREDLSLYVVKPAHDPEKKSVMEVKVYKKKEGKLTGHRPLYRGKHRSQTKGKGMMSFWRDQ